MSEYLKAWVPEPSDNEFKCELCGDIYPKGSEEEAVAEIKEVFGNYNPENCAVVCDKCYDEILTHRLQEIAWMLLSLKWGQTFEKWEAAGWSFWWRN